MKAVAARLGPVTPMALYRYVPGKEGLIDLILDAAVAEVPLGAGPGPDWRADLERVAFDTRAMIARHGWYAELVHTHPPAGPHAMRRLEFMLAVLVGRGASVADAMTWAALIDRHIVGSGRLEVEEARAERRAGLPHLTRWLAGPTGSGPEEQFTLGLGYLLDGIAAHPTP
jgi:AcrR family transcriptional regulator